jgi:hypothetical protein
MTEAEYLKYLENESQFSESQESYIRQEELRERKNKILMLLNGEVSADGEGDEEEEYGQEEEVS